MTDSDYDLSQKQQVLLKRVLEDGGSRFNKRFADKIYSSDPADALESLRMQGVIQLVDTGRYNICIVPKPVFEKLDTETQNRIKEAANQ